MAKIRVAIVGVGNCASSLIPGIEFYRHATGGDPIPGLMHLELGGYHIADIECVAAFDVAKTKVGHDLANALVAPPNNSQSPLSLWERAGGEGPRVYQSFPVYSCAIAKYCRRGRDRPPSHRVRRPSAADSRKYQGQKRLVHAAPLHSCAGILLRLS